MNKLLRINTTCTLESIIDLAKHYQDNSVQDAVFYQNFSGINFGLINGWLTSAEFNTPLKFIQDSYPFFDKIDLSEAGTLGKNLELIPVSKNDDTLTPLSIYISAGGIMIIYDYDIVVFIEPDGSRYWSRID